MTPRQKAPVAEEWTDLGPAVARIWAADDAEQAVSAAADGALSVPGVTGARCTLQRPDRPVEFAAVAGTWAASPSRLAGLVNRRAGGVDTVDRGLVDLHGGIIGTLAVQTPAGDAVLTDRVRLGVDALAAQAGHALVQLGLVERLGRTQSQLVAEQARARSLETTWQAAFDEAPIGMALLSLSSDRPGGLLKVNDALCRMTRRSAAQLTSSSMAELSHPDDYRPLASAFFRAVGGRRTSSTLVLRLYRSSAEGTVRVRVTTTPVFDDDNVPLYALSHIEDLTERDNPRDDPGTERDRETGLLSSAAFADAMSGTRRRALRAETKTAVLVCDLSLVDERTAALAPDAAKALRADLARGVQGVLRPDDAVGELDPGTIGVILAELSTADAHAVAARVNAVVTRTVATHVRDTAPAHQRAGEPPPSIAIATIDPVETGDAGTEVILGQALTLLRTKPTGRVLATGQSTLLEELGAKLILWERPEGDQLPQTTRVRLWPPP